MNYDTSIGVNESSINYLLLLISFEVINSWNKYIYSMILRYIYILKEKIKDIFPDKNIKIYIQYNETLT